MLSLGERAVLGQFYVAVGVAVCIGGRDGNTDVELLFTPLASVHELFSPGGLHLLLFAVRANENEVRTVERGRGVLFRRQ